MSLERAAAYIRVSHQEQALHGLSLEAQEAKLKEYANSHGLTIVGWYRDEGISGRKPISKRPELQRMIEDAQQAEFERIIFIKLDRFFRSVKEYYKAMEQLHDMPWTATEEQYDMTTANGKMLVNMKLTIAQLEADQTGERIKFVFDNRVKQGKAISGTRTLPLCYANENGNIVKRNSEMTMDMIEHYELTKSYRATMDYINDKYGAELRHNTVRTLLRNPMLCGEYRGNLNYCEPYISRERFRELLTLSGVKQRSETVNVLLFQGLIHCPECGRLLRANVHKSRGKEYINYRCDAHYKDRICGFSTAVFESTMERLLFANMQEILQDKIGMNAQKKAEKKTNTDKLKAELDRLNYAWQKGRLSPEDYDKRYDDIAEKIREAEATAAPDKLPKIYGLEYEEAVKSYNELTKKGRKSFWRSIVRRIDIDFEPGRTGKKNVMVDYI